MIKVKFYCNEIESEIYEYEDYTDKNDENFLDEMEQDRLDWIFNVIATGYIIID